MTTDPRELKTLGNICVYGPHVHHKITGTGGSEYYEVHDRVSAQVREAKLVTLDMTYIFS